MFFTYFSVVFLFNFSHSHRYCKSGAIKKHPILLFKIFNSTPAEVYVEPVQRLIHWLVTAERFIQRDL